MQKCRTNEPSDYRYASTCTGRYKINTPDPIVCTASYNTFIPEFLSNNTITVYTYKKL